MALWSRLDGKIGFALSQNVSRRMTQSKRDWVPLGCVFRHDRLVINGFVKASACQFVHGLIQVSRIVKYSDDCDHLVLPGEKVDLCG